MSFMHRLDATTAKWAGLVAELDRWGEAGRVATLWWRDDDVVAATSELDALLRLAGEVPLALAVIPAEAQPDLAAALSPFPQVAVLQHGWRHANHAANGKKSEFPPGRAAAEVAPSWPRAMPGWSSCSARAPCRSLCRRGTASPPNFCRCSPKLRGNSINLVSREHS